MPTRFPRAVPEIPVANIDLAAEYYLRLGFRLDWGNNEGGIAGISEGDCRLFLTNTSFRQHTANTAPVVVWLNLESREQVDELYLRWRDGGATLVSAPDDKPWHLREFTAADLDGNQLRVFYDFSHELQHKTP